VEHRVFGGCAGGSAVEFYVISNGSHTWPGFSPETFERLFGDRGVPAPTQEIDATTLIWAFWMQHPLADSSAAP
jgi:poly(3-hydroxybutyrate) depolymerase